MTTATGCAVRRDSGAARREFGVVLAVAIAGILTVLLVAFAPWYEATAAGGPGGDPPTRDPAVVRIDRDGHDAVRVLPVDRNAAGVRIGAPHVVAALSGS